MRVCSNENRTLEPSASHRRQSLINAYSARVRARTFPWRLDRILFSIRYSEKKPSFASRQFVQPRTETIVYNRLVRAHPIVSSHLHSPRRAHRQPPCSSSHFITSERPPKVTALLNEHNRCRRNSSSVGETNAAFDGYLTKNEPEPVLRTTLQQSSHNGQRIASVSETRRTKTVDDRRCVSASCRFPTFVASARSNDHVDVRRRDRQSPSLAASEQQQHVVVVVVLVGNDDHERHEFAEPALGGVVVAVEHLSDGASLLSENRIVMIGIPMQLNRILFSLSLSLSFLFVSYFSKRKTTSTISTRLCGYYSDKKMVFFSTLITWNLFFKKYNEFFSSTPSPSRTCVFSAYVTFAVSRKAHPQSRCLSDTLLPAFPLTHARRLLRE